MLAFLLPTLSQAGKVDLVQIDTGISEGLNGPLVMASNCFESCSHPHGAQMANAMNDELRKHKAGLVSAVQLHWHMKKSDELPDLILQAIVLKPRVISLSIEGKDATALEKLTIKLATLKGILVIAASGNREQNKDELDFYEAPYKSYPASYGFECLVSVSTKKKDGTMVESANPGHIYLLQTKGEHGTSFSTARAAGIAAWYFQKMPTSTCKDAEKWLKSTYSTL